jgi:hypothetical protein
MIALITSCIDPFNRLDQSVKSFIGTEERFEQTINTIKKLEGLPFRQLYLLDNSPVFDFSRLSGRVDGELAIRQIKQYQFANKGINELLLLLAVVDELPANEPLFKISGRYFPNGHFICEIGKGYDFKVRPYDFSSRTGTISTRGYWVANKTIYKEFLLKCLNEAFIYPQRMVGLRSVWQSVKQVLKPEIPVQPFTAIEFAAARVLKNSSHKVQFTDEMGIEGIIAGFGERKLIRE